MIVDVALVGAGIMSATLGVLAARSAGLHRRPRYCPAAQADDWEVQIAGLRVQIIKAGPDGRGELKFGTEVVTSADGSIAALLGASPGASTAVAIMLELLQRCFPERWRAGWSARCRELIPSFGRSLGDDPALVRALRARWKP